MNFRYRGKLLLGREVTDGYVHLAFFPYQERDQLDPEIDAAALGVVEVVVLRLGLADAILVLDGQEGVVVVGPVLAAGASLVPD